MAKRLRMLFLLLLLLAFTALLSLAEEEKDEGYLAYFENSAYVRPEANQSKDAIAVIPPNLPVRLIKADDRYAAVQYDGVSGYVLLKGALRVAETTELTPLYLRSNKNKFLYEYPMTVSDHIATIPRNTPILVTGEAGFCYRAQFGEMTGYILKRDLLSMPMDTLVVPYDAFSRVSVPVRDFPLDNAQASGTLNAFQVYSVTARANGFLKVVWGASEGYVEQSLLEKFTEQTSTLRAGLLSGAGTLYERPDAAFLTEKTLEKERLYILDSESSAFYHLRDEDAYVLAKEMTTWAVSLISTIQIYADKETALLLAPEIDAPKAGAALKADGLYTVGYRAGDYYFLSADGVNGFVKRGMVEELTAGRIMNRTAAVMAQKDRLYMFGGEQVYLKMGEKVMITRSAGSFYECETAAGKGFVRVSALRLIGADAPLDGYRVAAPFDIPLVDFPDSALGAEVFMIPKDSVVKVTAVNRCYLLVECEGKTGYAAQGGLLSAETEGMPGSENIPAYEVALDKETRMAYVFILDEKGERESAAACALVAVGKRTTPTPSGEFTLGRKERWHRFTQTYTPFTTAFTDGRYIHGLPCESKSLTSIVDSLAYNAGQAVTGGCWRSPVEFARFVYLNCPSYLTRCTIVNGGLKLPDEMDAPAAPPQADAPAAMDEGGEPEDDDPENIEGGTLG